MIYIAYLSSKQIETFHVTSQEIISTPYYDLIGTYCERYKKI